MNIIDKISNKMWEPFDKEYQTAKPLVDNITKTAKITTENGTIQDIKMGEESIKNNKKLQKLFKWTTIYCAGKIAIKEANKDHYITKSKAELLQSKPQKAIQTLEQCLDIAPTDPTVYKGLAINYLLTGNQEKSQENYSLAQRMINYEQ